MDANHFWKLIEASRGGFDPSRVDGNMARQLEDLQGVLLELRPEEIVSFRDQFVARMNEAYRWDLWGAAYIIAGGCSDDGFVDFRSWLISMGRRVFEEAVANPEAIVDVAAAPGVEDVFFEELQHVAARAYEELTGREIPAYAGHAPATPEGEAWGAGADLARRLPRLWSKYRLEPAEAGEAGRERSKK